MTVYYQHIGERLSARDFPRSLGTQSSGLKRFNFGDVAEFLDHLNPFETSEIKSKMQDFAPTGFQIWGIPSGAQSVIANMQTGDYLMLLESTDFTYCGQVIHRVSDLCHDLSYHIWGEQRFPIIIFLQGEMISYGWDEFKEDFDFAFKYHMRGHTANISPVRMANSNFQNEDKFIASLLTTKGSNPFDQEIDFSAFAEGLVSHLREVKEREAQHRFRKNLFEIYRTECAFCDFDVPVALEAAHIIPKHENGTDDPRNGLILCAVHHRIFDANGVGINPTGLAIVPRHGWRMERLRVSRQSISHLATFPHAEALLWRWNQFRRNGDHE
jgi:hypothetical protein